MYSRSLRPRALAAAVAALVAASGMGSTDSIARSPVSVTDATKADPYVVVGTQSKQGVPARYIVRFVEQPLALYNSVAATAPVAGIGAIPSKPAKNGRLRLDVKSSQAVAYVQYIKEQQHQHLSAINAALGKPVSPRYTMQHALNAAVMELTPEQAAKVAKVSGVRAVTLDVPHRLATDIGPGFIGAASIWWGAPASQDTIFANAFEAASGFLGDGIVIGDIDTGYNSLSPSFQPTDAHGYTVQNPLGSGNYLGQCNLGSGASGISLAGCNDKVIGAYDEIDLTCTGAGCPTTFSVEDTQGHGSHTASTAAGNFRTANLSGYGANIAGVAPHANLVIYYACSPDPAVQCSTAATSASVDQAIQDGVVDALNYSISGGDDPWNDPTSLAFLSAADAGIFVAAAAGNTSASVPLPLPGTANHAEPWVTTVAASNHTGGSIVNFLSAVGPGTPPANTQNLAMQEGSGDGYTGSFSAAIPATSIVVSPTFHANDTSGSDGCAAFAPNQFQNAIALLSRGTCSFETKAVNAQAAGAVAVVISDNRPEGVFPPGLGTSTISVPVWIMGQTDGINLAAFVTGNAGATAQVPYFGQRLGAQPDELANFSLLGPVTIDVMKPDVQAPGVSILAAVANDGTPNGPNLVALYNGTSMATPHTTGSSALLFGLHPDWTPAETKSALMMTAKEAGLTKANGTTPSDNFDRGSGRIQDFIASKAGLVMNETGLNYALADPAIHGDPSTLNVPSMYSQRCLTGPDATCSFTRKFHSTQSKTVTWTATVSGDPALAIDVKPASFQVVAHGTRQVDVAVDASGTNSDGLPHFAEIVLTADDPTLPPLHLPVAITVPTPSITATPQPLAIAISSGNTTGSGSLTIGNVGGPTLNVTNTNDTSGNAPFVVIDQPSQGNNGYFSTFFTDFSSGGYAADDFTVPVNGSNLTKIRAPGFTTGGVALSSLTGHGVHVRIYGGTSAPNGDPEGATSATAAVYSFDTTIGHAGVSVAGDTVSINLATAGAPATNLAAGTYWMVVYVDMDYGSTGGWAQFVSDTNSGATANAFCPACGDPGWAPITNHPGFALHIEQQVPCGAAWLSATPSTLSVPAGGTAPLTVNVDAAQFPGTATSASAFLCLDSNDPLHPVLPVQVNAQASVTTVTVNEGFDDITTLAGKGWFTQNNSTNAGSALTTWFQGTNVAASGPFDAQAGASPNSYIGANFNNTTGTGTISNWLVTPPITFNLLSSVSFYTRSIGGAQVYPDRVEIRVCTTGACTNVGTLPTDVGDFTTVLKSINPSLNTNDDPTGATGYPLSAWAPFTVDKTSGMPTSGTGRVAFRYFVTNGGPTGANSNYIGIDTVSITAGAVGPTVPGLNGPTPPSNPADARARSAH